MAFSALPTLWQNIFVYLEKENKSNTVLPQVLRECATLKFGEQFQPVPAVKAILNTETTISGKCILLERILHVYRPGNPYHRKLSSLETWHVEALLHILDTPLHPDYLNDQGWILARFVKTCGMDISSQITDKLQNAPFLTRIAFVLEYSNNNILHPTHLQARHLETLLDLVWYDQQISMDFLILTADELFRLLQLTVKFSQVSLTEAFNILLISTSSIQTTKHFRDILLPLIDLLLHFEEHLPPKYNKPAVLPANILRGQVSEFQGELVAAVSNFIYHTLTCYIRLSVPNFPKLSNNLCQIDWSISYSGCASCIDCLAVAAFLRNPDSRTFEFLPTRHRSHIATWFRGVKNFDGTIICGVSALPGSWPVRLSIVKQPIPNEATVKQLLKNRANNYLNKQKATWHRDFAATYQAIRRLDDGPEGFDNNHYGIFNIAVKPEQRLKPLLGPHYDAVMLCNPELLPNLLQHVPMAMLRRPSKPYVYSPCLLPNSLAISATPPSQAVSAKSIPLPPLPDDFELPSPMDGISSDFSTLVDDIFSNSSSLMGDILSDLPTSPMEEDISDALPACSDTHESLFLTPTLFRVHCSYLLHETLDYYRIPWRVDGEKSDFIIIEQEIPESTLKDMFWHTQRVFDRVKTRLQNDAYMRF